MKRILSVLVMIGFFSVLGCDTNKPAEEAIDAKDRVKDKVQGIRDDQQKAAEDAGVEDQPESEE
jgi:hypothetical protein